MTAISNVVGDCTNTISLTIDFTYAAVTADMGFPDMDIVALIIVDANDNYVAGVSIWTDVGRSGSVSNFALIPLSIVTRPQQSPFSIRVYDVNTIHGDYAFAQLSPLLDVFSFDPLDFGACTSLLYGSGGSDVGPAFVDGRINNWDTGSPVVVYGHDGESGRGLVIYSPEGLLLLLVSAEELARVGECPAENTLIASAGAVEVYRLSSCEYQINAPSLDGTKTYVLIFNGLYENTGYSSYET